MSGWQPCLDQSIVGAGFRQGAILLQSGETLVATENFKVNPDQARKLLAVLQGTGGAAAEVTANGFVISGVRYALVRAELDEECELRYLVGRCKQFGAPVQGIIIVPTYRALLFAVHDPLHSPDLSFGRANVTMTCLAEELMSQNI